MQLMLACASHSPLIYFPAIESPAFGAMRRAMTATSLRIHDFDPELIVLIGCDHYGGQQMSAMPAFCVGVEASAIADVGGTAGVLNVPRKEAVAAVTGLRERGVDVAVSYAMEVDHGFSQILKELAGGVGAYPVLPIFVSCLQPPFVPFRRARALGVALGEWIATLPYQRVLIMGTGGLSHDPSSLFPSIDEVSDEWRPYITHGKRQGGVTQQSWVDYEIAAHRYAAEFLVTTELTLDQLSIRENWDKAFLDSLATQDLAMFDGWKPETVVAEGGFGAMEILTWLAAVQAMQVLTGARPGVTFHAPLREAGIGFGIVETPPTDAFAR